MRRFERFIEATSYKINQLRTASGFCHNAKGTDEYYCIDFETDTNQWSYDVRIIGYWFSNSNDKHQFIIKLSIHQIFPDGETIHTWPETMDDVDAFQSLIYRIEDVSGISLWHFHEGIDKFREWMVIVKKANDDV